MQEQRIPTLTSVEDQIAAKGLSQVTSEETEMEYRDWRRRMETMHVLWVVCQYRNFPRIKKEEEERGHCATYMPPSPKTAISAIFCR